MSGQSPRLILFFLSIPISLPPLLLRPLLSFYHSHSLFLPFHSPRLALFCFCFLFPSLLPSYPCFLFLLPFLSPSCFPFFCSFFPPLSTFPFFLSSLMRPFFTILLHFLVASYFVLPLLSACPSLHSFLYSLSPLFTQFHSSPILGTCYPILVPLLSILYLSSHLLWLRFIFIYILFIYSQSCLIIRTFPPIHAGTELFRLCCPILILPQFASASASIPDHIYTSTLMIFFSF